MGSDIGRSWKPVRVKRQADFNGLFSSWVRRVARGQADQTKPSQLERRSHKRGCKAPRDTGPELAVTYPTAHGKLAPPMASKPNMNPWVGTAPAALAAQAAAGTSSVSVVIEGDVPAHPFPHFWEQMFGSGRATLSLRAQRRNLHDAGQVPPPKIVPLAAEHSRLTLPLIPHALALIEVVN